jgi:hypothetical protein
VYFVSRLAGHGNAGFTLSRYGGMLDGEEQGEAAKVALEAGVPSEKQARSFFASLPPGDVVGRQSTQSAAIRAAAAATIPAVESPRRHGLLLEGVPLGLAIGAILVDLRLESLEVALDFRVLGRFHLGVDIACRTSAHRPPDTVHRSVEQHRCGLGHLGH